MKTEKLDLQATGLFSQALLDFIDRKDDLQPFYHRFPEIEAYQGQIKDKEKYFTGEKRKVLVEVLKEQYKSVGNDAAVHESISSLAKNTTFTVTTGHQLNIFTGPLYFHYKIITVINAARRLKEAYPKYDFVPVYWMASEDHDIDEIRSVRVGGKRYRWETEQTGPVGRFQPDGLSKIASKMPGNTDLFRKAYEKYDSLAEAVRAYVHELYGEEGLVVIDPDDTRLKKFLIPVIKDDIFNNSAKTLVDQATEELEKLGYQSQIYPREINFFYIEDGLRERIIQQGDKYHVNNTEYLFSKPEIEKEIEEHPEKFSPNVILRPLYQEIILPNLSYSGGPAEQVYWLQLKSVFDHYKVPFPILLPRNFAMLIDHTVLRKMSKAEISVGQTFTNTPELVKKTVERFTKHDISLDKEKHVIEDLFKEIKQRAVSIDSTLERTVMGEARKAEKIMEKIQKKIYRSERRTLEDKTSQVEDIRSKLFPNDNPQERVMNFLDFDSSNGSLMKEIQSQIDPFDLRYHIILLDEPEKEGDS